MIRMKIKDSLISSILGLIIGLGSALILSVHDKILFIVLSIIMFLAGVKMVVRP